MNAPKSVHTPRKIAGTSHTLGSLVDCIHRHSWLDRGPHNRLGFQLTIHDDILLFVLARSLVIHDGFLIGDLILIQSGIEGLPSADAVAGIVQCSAISQLFQSLLDQLVFRRMSDRDLSSQIVESVLLLGTSMGLYVMRYDWILSEGSQGNLASAICANLNQ